jgi:hypothetical protein
MLYCTVWNFVSAVYLFVEKGSGVSGVRCPRGILKHVNTLEVVTDAEEEGQIVAPYNIHGHCLQQRLQSAA